jgi:tmRNA-binding protein
LPQVLGLNIEENLEPKLAYLQKRLVLNENELSKLVQSLPPALGLNIEENLEPKLEYLRKRLLLNEKELRRLVQKLPQVFSSSIEINLEPTIEFFEDLIGVSDAKGFLMKDPSVIGRSLEKRLKPRLAEVREAGIPLDSGTLSRMAKYTEEKWSASMTYQKKRLLLSKEELW